MPEEIMPEMPLPPVARREPHATTLHGHTLHDDYAWLRNKDSQEVTAYLEAENAYAEAWMAPTKPTAGDALSRDAQPHQGDRRVLPLPLRRLLLLLAHRRGLAVHHLLPPQGHSMDDAAKQIILDGNELAKGHPFMALGGFAISEDQNLLAYSVDHTGFRQYTLHTQGPAHRRDAPRHRRARRLHRLGQRQRAPSSTPSKMKRPSASTSSIATPSASRNRQTRSSSKSPTSASTSAPARPATDNSSCSKSAATPPASPTSSPRPQPTAAWTLIEPRRDNIEYYADHRDGLFYIRANDTGRNFRLVTTPVDQPSSKNWRELIPHRDDVMLEDVDLFATFAAIGTRSNGLPHIEIAPFAEGGALGPSREIALPEPVYTVHGGTNPDFATTSYRYGYQSLVTPASVYELDIATHESILRKQQEVPGGFDRVPLCFRPRLRHRGRRHADPRLHRLPPRHARRPPIPCTSTPTAPTATRCPSASTAIASACSIAASSWPTRTSAAAATWASPGTMPAASCRSATPSPTSSPPSSTSPRTATAIPRASPSKAAAPAACSWAPSPTCAPTSSAPSSPTCPSST